MIDAAFKVMDYFFADTDIVIDARGDFSLISQLASTLAKIPL